MENISNILQKHTNYFNQQIEIIKTSGKYNMPILSNNEDLINELKHLAVFKKPKGDYLNAGAYKTENNTIVMICDSILQENIILCFDKPYWDNSLESKYVTFEGIKLKD